MTESDTAPATEAPAHPVADKPLTIVQAGHPVLRQVSPPVSDNQRRDPAFAALVEAMKRTMHEAPGVGLAAPQVAASTRLAVVEDQAAYLAHIDDSVLEQLDRRPLPFTALINPTVEPVDDEIVLAFEGCLSVDGYRALVPRHRQVRVRWTNLDGTPGDETWSGWPARIAQHESDHLDGVLYVDRMVRRSFMTHSEWQLRWIDMSIDEVCAALAIDMPESLKPGSL